MINKSKITFLFGIFIILFGANSLNAQLKQGDLVDGIAAVSVMKLYWSRM